MPASIEIVTIDPHDDALLREWYDVAAAIVRHDRPQASLRTWAALANSVQSPGEYRRRVLLGARLAGRLVGIAELGGAVKDNVHLADLEISVLPAQRRRGIGAALQVEAAERLRADGRTSVVGELHVPSGTTPEQSAGYAFAVARGFGSVHEEDHLVLTLPPDPATTDLLASRVAERALAYEIVSWGNDCPEEYLESFCSMQTQMANDVPLGEVDQEPVVVDAERVRTQEQRQSLTWIVVTAAARSRADGVMAGYSQLFLARDDDQVIQDDTLVMPDHRGHRLGTAMKLATLDVVRREHPGRAAIHTYTDPSNHAMYRTNIDFGFVTTERMHEMQRKE